MEIQLQTKLQSDVPCIWLFPAKLMNSWAFKMKCKQTFAPNWASFFWLVFILWIKRPWTKELLPELQYGGWLNLLNVFEESNLGDLVWFPPQGHELLLLANLPRTSSKNKHIDVGQWFVWRCAKREFSIVTAEFLPCGMNYNKHQIPKFLNDVDNGKPELAQQRLQMPMF